MNGIPLTENDFSFEIPMGDNDYPSIPSLVAYTVSSNVFHRTFGKARFGIKNRQCYLSQEFDV